MMNQPTEVPLTNRQTFDCLGTNHVDNCAGRQRNALGAQYLEQIACIHIAAPRISNCNSANNPQLLAKAKDNAQRLSNEHKAIANVRYPPSNTAAVVRDQSQQ